LPLRGSCCVPVASNVTRHEESEAFIAGAQEARTNGAYDEGTNALGIAQGNSVGVPKWKDKAISMLGAGATDVDVCTSKTSIVLGKNIRCFI
jgi:hypothetical protein